MSEMVAVKLMYHRLKPIDLIQLQVDASLESISSATNICSY
jgi:hypothetical protein